MAELPNAPVKRLIIEGSQGMRLSGSALDLAAEHLSNMVRLLGYTAAGHAAADNRKTIRDEDINAAWSELTS